MIAQPSLKSRELISNSRLITVISGSIGFEALMLKKPVVVLGRAPFNFLPKSMICHADSPGRLGNDIRDLLEHYKYNEAALLSCISAVIKESVPVDFYSKLLGRKGTYSPTPAKGDREAQESERIKHINLLARYLVHRLDKFKFENLDLH